MPYYRYDRHCSRIGPRPPNVTIHGYDLLIRHIKKLS